MKIFVYEYVSGGGLLAADSDQPIPPSLLREGIAMLSAVVADFCAIDGVTVMTLRDCRIHGTAEDAEGRRGKAVSDRLDVRGGGASEKELAAFDELVSEADATLIIAPEIEGALLARCQRVEHLGGRLLGPSATFVELTSDKQRTTEWLAVANVPTPWGCAIDAGQSLPADFLYPAVLKPRDGAGSQNVRFLECFPSGHEEATVAFAARLERFCPGIAVSVAFLCGPRQRIPLPACRQHLSTDGAFRYLGGSCPLPAELAIRAQSLAMRAVATLPEPRGYLGLDLVLGNDPDGRDDVVIEINPRLTTSYVGLRQLAQQNLADAMLTIMDGRETALSFKHGGVQFGADGTVTSWS